MPRRFGDLHCSRGRTSPVRSLTTINENALLLGVVARPMDALRITADLEFGYNDQSYTRIDPRQVQSYKIQANYKPRPWANLDGAVEIHENRDNVSTVNNLEHDRSYSFSAMLTANPTLSVDFGLQLLERLHPGADLLRVLANFRTNPAPPPATVPVSLRFLPACRCCQRARRARLRVRRRLWERFRPITAPIISPTPP